MQVHEKVGKSRFTLFFQRFVALEGRKVGSLKRRVRSQLAKWEMNNCTALWREAHFQVKMYKTQHSQTTFRSWDVAKVHAVSVCRTCKGPRSYDKGHHIFNLLDISKTASADPVLSAKQRWDWTQKGFWISTLGRGPPKKNSPKSGNTNRKRISWVDPFGCWFAGLGLASAQAPSLAGFMAVSWQKLPTAFWCKSHPQASPFLTITRWHGFGGSLDPVPFAGQSLQWAWREHWGFHPDVDWGAFWFLDVRVRIRPHCISERTRSSASIGWWDLSKCVAWPNSNTLLCPTRPYILTHPYQICHIIFSKMISQLSYLGMTAQHAGSSSSTWRSRTQRDGWRPRRRWSRIMIVMPKWFLYMLIVVPFGINIFQ